ncbi:Rieske (2Fe-2S) protein [Nocardioides hwasunensis]|uniref:Cytochrome bc1 complex Rieske iron-sulfur subunit n=1 Tax=Nocardioides hwasunensis TaxID=397258 RepID=A0ABR8MBY2_9ACTN|nr:Rieske (2Fe-2S) protein [Nocardioides hwasunensis]MBD3913633.1 Rieske (2Fe-2S) protein [Nocardioides hwasunensis]
MTTINRRRALSGTAAFAIGVPVLAACGSDDTATDPGASGADDPSSDPTSEPTSSGSASSGGGDSLASASDVPVGGCFVAAAAKVVVTQPTEGEFKAFSAVCTHQGCAVESSTEGDIPCPCHGSKFSLEDGSPLSGPATAALASVAITVDGDSILRA